MMEEELKKELVLQLGTESLCWVQRAKNFDVLVLKLMY